MSNLLGRPKLFSVLPQYVNFPGSKLLLLMLDPQGCLLDPYSSQLRSYGRQMSPISMELDLKGSGKVFNSAHIDTDCCHFSIVIAAIHLSQSASMTMLRGC